MDTPVSHQPASIIPKMTPVAMKSCRVKAPIRRWSQPRGKIYTYRNSLIFLFQRSNTVIKICPNIHLAQGSYGTGFYVIHYAFPDWGTPLLLTYLYDPAIFSGSI